MNINHSTYLGDSLTEDTRFWPLIGLQCIPIFKPWIGLSNSLDLNIHGNLAIMIFHIPTSTLEEWPHMYASALKVACLTPRSSGNSGLLQVRRIYASHSSQSLPGEDTQSQELAKIVGRKMDVYHPIGVGNWKLRFCLYPENPVRPPSFVAGARMARSEATFCLRNCILTITETYWGITIPFHTFEDFVILKNKPEKKSAIDATTPWRWK